MEFSVIKKTLLNKNDLSRKGSIDSKIIELVNFINSHDAYVTTSSCSGRTSVFVRSELKKKGCDWLFISHDIVCLDDVIHALENHAGSATLKFEPFVLHVQCSTLEAAQKLHTAGIESGFRNSGLSISKKGKIISAIRSTLSLEVPLSCEGKMLVSSEYLSYVVNICNEKMEENLERIQRLFLQLKVAFVKSTNKTDIEQTHSVTSSKNNTKRPSKEIKPQEKENETEVLFDGKLLDDLLKM